MSTLDFSIVLSSGGGGDLTWTSRPWLSRGDLYVTVGVDKRPDVSVPMLSIQGTPDDMRAFGQRFIDAAGQAEAREETLRAEAKAAATAAQEAHP